MNAEDRKKIDALYYTPHERATGLHTIIMAAIQKETQDDVRHIDIAHWAAYILHQMRDTFDDEVYTDIAKAMLSYLHTAHYTNPEIIYGKPDRKST